MNNGFFRVAAVSPMVEVANCPFNVGHIADAADKLAAEAVDVAVYPEMSVTAYTCADLFHNRGLLNAAYDGLGELCRRTAHIDMAIVVGMPLLVGYDLYNCAIVLHRGVAQAVIPKSYLPNYNEFYEKRWWRPAPDEMSTIDLMGSQVPFGTQQMLSIGGVRIGVEICEDLWVPVPPSTHACMAGAEVILNLSASDDVIGKYAYLNSLIAQQSARCMCAYVYASAGYGESSTDLVFDGKAIIAENGTVLVRNRRWQSDDQYVIADIDIEALRRDRMHLCSFADCAARERTPRYDITEISVNNVSMCNGEGRLYRVINPMPFVPPTDQAMAERCEEIINIQVAGLAKRLHAIGCHSLVVGVSGGLDSTLALLVAAKAFDRLGLDRQGIIGITMPGFGTSGRTHDNAVRLMRQLDVTIREIPIGEAVTLHFKDIGHDPETRDVTYENCQARERTQILMDVANQCGGIVLGTGDMSELALGWATYNGDHMSMYGVNAGVPKTLVRYLVRHFAVSSADEASRATLLDIVETPISPELIPADDNGNITQKTEDLVGPYELHDFFLYYTLRYGTAPDRILYLATIAFDGRYDKATVKHWLETFLRRFVRQQFKRSCLPDGPKVGSVCLSPRGDWRMPSDASILSLTLDAD